MPRISISKFLNTGVSRTEKESSVAMSAAKKLKGPSGSRPPFGSSVLKVPSKPYPQKALVVSQVGDPKNKGIYIFFFFSLHI